MTKINNNATEILKTVVMKRNWYQGKIERRHAAVTKANTLAGKISYEKAASILEMLGWEKVQEETWKAPGEKN